jgi:hypothetical protein
MLDEAIARGFAGALPNPHRDGVGGASVAAPAGY